MSFVLTHFANLLGRADHHILRLANIPLLCGYIADIQALCGSDREIRLFSFVRVHSGNIRIPQFFRMRLWRSAQFFSEIFTKRVKKNGFGGPFFLLTAEVTVPARAPHFDPVCGSVTGA